MKVGMRAGEDDARPLGVFLHCQDERLDAVADLVVLQRRLLPRGEDPLGAAQVDVDRVLGFPLEEAVDQLALLVGELVVYDVLFRFLYLLYDDLLGGLRGDPAERLERIFLDVDVVPQLPRPG